MKNAQREIGQANSYRYLRSCSGLAAEMAEVNQYDTAKDLRRLDDFSNWLALLFGVVIARATWADDNNDLNGKNLCSKNCAGEGAGSALYECKLYLSSDTKSPGNSS